MIKMTQLSVLRQAIFKKTRLVTLCFVLLSLFFIVLTFNLGVWQLDRAEQKEHLLESLATETIHLASQWPQIQNGQRMNLTGRYLVDQQFLIDNKTVNGEFGYDLVVPFVSQINTERVLFWTNVGWVKGAQKRETLTHTALPQEEVSILVRAYLPNKSEFRLSDQQFENLGWPKRVQYFDVDFFYEQLQVDTSTQGFNQISHYEIRLEDGQPGVQVRRWLPEKIMPPQKHVAYAVQWFFLCVVLMVLTSIFLWRHYKESQNHEI